MFFATTVFVAAILNVALVGAQSGTASSAAPTSTNGISPCLISCVTQAASSAGCSSFTDVQCVCTSTQFQSAALSCLQSNCSTTELQAGQALQQQECATVSGATSLTGSAVSAASSALSSLSSAASSFGSSVTSRASGAGSAFSSATSAAGSAFSSATNAAGSVASTAASGSSTSAAGSMGAFDAGSLLSAAVGILGLAVGALVV